MIRSCLLATALLAAGPALAEETPPEWLFVHTAAGFGSDGTSLIMPMDRDIFAFTDRPNRLHAYLNAHEFLALWESGEDNFRSDPPNAVLTWIADGEIQEAEIELRDAETHGFGRAIKYEVAFEAGTPLPETGAYASLFIDSDKDALDDAMTKLNARMAEFEKQRAQFEQQQSSGKVNNLGTIYNGPGDVMVIGGGDGCAVRQNGVCLDK